MQETRGTGSIPGSGRPWRRRWHSSAVFLPEKFYGEEEPGGLQSVGLQKQLNMFIDNTILIRQTAPLGHQSVER